jgi:hypothetical protein
MKYTSTTATARCEIATAATTAGNNENAHPSYSCWYRPLATC